jgi:hypothetical protein
MTGGRKNKVNEAHPAVDKGENRYKGDILINNNVTVIQGLDCKYFTQMGSTI